MNRALPQTLFVISLLGALGFAGWRCTTAEIAEIPRLVEEEQTSMAGGRPLPEIGILPIDGPSSAELSIVQQALAKTYMRKVVILPKIKHPQETWSHARGRIQADKLLPWMERQPKFFERFEAVVAVTPQDISTYKDKDHPDWGVFGLGNLPGRACVVSSFRLKKPGEKALKERLGVIAVHEVGHNIGLRHCETPKCLMNDAKGTIKTVDESTGKFCTSCLKQLPAQLIRQ